MESDQIRRLQERFAAIPKSVRDEVQPALAKSGDELASRMKQLAPRDSGDLIDSIAVTTAGNATPAYSQPGGSMIVSENAVAITVGNSKVRYAHLQEYGTAHAHAQPFFWVSYRLLKKRLSNRIKRSINKAIKQEWGQ
jgi:HK97 gp10 family phage protein